MKWASALSTQPTLALALDETIATIEQALDQKQAHLLFAFSSCLYGDDIALLPKTIAARFNDAVLVGCSGGGIIGATHEIEQGPALTLLAAHLPDVAIKPFHLEQEAIKQLQETPATLRKRLDCDADQQPCFILLPEPFSCNGEKLIGALDKAFPGCPKIGGLASGESEAGKHALIINDQIKRKGMVGLALYGDIEMRPLLAQGCRPIGAPMIVTNCTNNLLFSLNGQPATQALDELYASLSKIEQNQFRTSPHLGLAMLPQQQVLSQGDFLIRNLIGVGREAGVLAIGALLEENQTVQFHLRDPETASAELHDLLGRYSKRSASQPAAGALLFSCLGRGKNLFGVDHHDASVFAQHTGDVPLSGFFCNGEIGPLHGQTFLHGYTSAFGVFSGRAWS